MKSLFLAAATVARASRPCVAGPSPAFAGAGSGLVGLGRNPKAYSHKVTKPRRKWIRRGQVSSFMLTSRSDAPSHGITRKQAEPLIVALAAAESLGIEQVTLIGSLKKVDVRSGRWQLHVLDEDREYSGKSRPGVSLSNITTERMDRLVCDEEIMGLTGTGQEKKVLHLTLFEELTGQV